MIRFNHFRDISNDGKVSERGGATVAYEVDSENRVTRYAVARCSRLDNFSREIGRNIAGGRINAPFLHFRTNVPVEQFVKSIDSIIEPTGFKRRQRAAV